MVHYGLILGLGSLVFINGVGAALNGIYTLMYLIVAKEKVKDNTSFMLCATIVDSLYDMVYALHE